MSQPPPGSLGAPYLGEALQFLKDPFTFTLSRTRRHGNVWRTRILGDTVVFFAGPEAFSFFLDEANFTRDALDSYLPGITQIFARYTQRWAGGGEQAVVDDLAQLGFDVADMLFAASDPATSNVERGRDFMTMLRGTFAPPVNLPFTAYGKAIKARDRMRAYIHEAVATKDGAGSALSVLKAARGPKGEQLDARELEIELLHFYFAAHGGLTAALAWLLVVLGEHPDIARRLRDEADAQLGDGTPTLAQIEQLAYARAVSREVLRSYPIAPTTFIGVAKRDLEHAGFSIRAGWKGAGAIWATLQDGTTFRDPATFDAERLGDDAVRALPANAFVPQGGGPRDGHRCAGEALIQLVMPMFLGWFSRRYDLTWPAQSTSPVGGGLGPLPKDGVRLAITPRG
jgi:cytochrome P450